MSYSEDEIKSAVLCSLNLLLRTDAHLLNDDVHEQAVCAALAGHLKAHFPGYNVDVEYNRKVVNGTTRVKNPGGAVGGRLDLLVHRRGLGGSENNLLAMEAQKAGKAFDDLEKQKVVQASSPGQPSVSDSATDFVLGALLTFPGPTEAGSIEWYKAGNPINTETFPQTRTDRR